MDTPNAPTVNLPAEIAESIAARLRVDLEAAATEAEAQNLRADRCEVRAREVRAEVARLEAVRAEDRTDSQKCSLRTMRGSLTSNSNAAADARRAADRANERFREIERDLTALCRAQRAAR